MGYGYIARGGVLVIRSNQRLPSAKCLHDEDTVEQEEESGSDRFLGSQLTLSLLSPCPLLERLSARFIIDTYIHVGLP